MQRTLYNIPGMDCPSEESLIRLKLAEIAEVKNLEFDLAARRLSVYHDGALDRIETAIFALNLGAKRMHTEQAEPEDAEEPSLQRRLLWAVLAINGAFFVVEMAAGLMSGSMGLVADSLDMLADAFVYAISLLAVGAAVVRKKRIATIAGYFQSTLAIIGFAEVVRRFVGTVQPPDFATMIVVSALALGANAFCLYLLQKSKSREAHMQASMIFTSNDVIINLGVIVAGVLVLWLNSSIPDLIVGAAVFVLVMRGAVRILKLGK